jgi:hypothetical protein
VLIWILNIVIGVISVAVFVGWMRNRRREDYGDISRAEISDDLRAQDELLEDVLSQQDPSRSGWAESSRATERDRAD